eukprot:Pgem_evm4s20065
MLFNHFYNLEKKRRSPRNIMALNSETKPIFNKALASMRDINVKSLPKCYKNYINSAENINTNK